VLRPAPSPDDSAVISFTGHVLVVADVEPSWVSERLPHGELGDVYTPPFLGALAARTGRRVNAIDLLALAPPGTGTAGVELTATAADHPRVRRARRYRSDVSVYVCEGGVVTIGRGLAGRFEVGIEVADGYRDAGLGRRLAEAARGLVPGGRPLWAQIAPGNAASLRAFLAAGYVPVGMEALLVTHRGER
jgi:hypothetical protein